VQVLEEFKAIKDSEASKVQRVHRVLWSVLSILPLNPIIILITQQKRSLVHSHYAVGIANIGFIISKTIVYDVN